MGAEKPVEQASATPATARIVMVDVSQAAVAMSSSTCQYQLMVLRHALLGLLARAPMSGYELTKCFDQSLAHTWAARHSQIYPELARLLADGLIRQSDEGPRGRKTYSITEQGLVAVRRWLTETEPEHTSRNEAALRTFFLWLLEPEQAQQHLLREREVHAAQLAEFERVAEAEAPDTPALRSSRMALEWGMRYERALGEWIEWALAEISAAAIRS